MDAGTMAGLFFTGVTLVGGATWAICWKLSEIKEALSMHVVENESEHKALDGRVIKLEGRRRR
jgi:hypothetical protein